MRRLPPVESTTQSESKPEYVLAELLDKPRSELANLAAELQTRSNAKKGDSGGPVAFGIAAETSHAFDHSHLERVRLF